MADFAINTRPQDKQPNPAVAALPDGGFIATWQSEYQDGMDWGIFAQRFNANGAAVGPEFQINVTTKDTQDTPAIATAADGSFIVTWQSRDFGGTENDVFARRYDAAGNPIGSEFKVNTVVANWQQNSAIAILPNGNFVITWESAQQDVPSEGDGYGVFARQFRADGTPIGSEFKVNTFTQGNQNKPAITTLKTGGFVITWQSELQDGSEYGIYGQTYNADGVPLGSEFRINTYGTTSQNRPAVAPLNDGGFVATWTSYGQDGDNYGIIAKRFSATGTPVGDEFVVNSQTAGEQITPQITELSNGGFVVTWRSQSTFGGDYGVFARQYGANGQPVGNEVQVNTFATQDKGKAAITALNNGGYAVVWHSADPTGASYRTYERRYDAAGNPASDPVQVNTYVAQVSRITPVNPPAGVDSTIVIAASDTDPISAAQATYRATGVNDHLIINKAIAEAYATGKGTVVLLPGVFNISNNILLRSNVTLKGSGWRTKLRLEDNANLDDAGIIRTQGPTNKSSDVEAYNTRIADLQIDGNKDRQSSDKNKYGIYGVYANSSFENIYVRNTSSYGFDPHENSINGTPSTNITIRNNIVENAGKDGITLDKVVDSLVENNITVNNHRHGFNVVTEATNTTIKNNVAIGNGSNGITIQTGSRNLSILNNQIALNKANGIYVDGEGGNRIDSNVIERNGRYGVALLASSGNTVSNNLVFSNSQSKNAGYSEIELYDDGINYSTYNTIRNNDIESALDIRASYSVRERSPGDNYNTIENNIAVGALRKPYLIKGKNSVLVPQPTQRMGGTSQIDTLTGTKADNVIAGKQQSDILSGVAGDDVLMGGAGNDRINGGTGNDGLWGQSGSDYLRGLTGNDQMNGGTGNDKMLGDQGNDVMLGGSGKDYLQAGLGNDYLYGGSQNDSLYGRGGNDYLYGDIGNDGLRGENGNDYLDGGDGSDQLNGGAGNDVLDGGTGSDILNGDIGDDFLKGGTENDRLLGAAGNDYLDGGKGDDNLDGGDNDDLLEGDDGNDVLQGGNGNDILKGNAGVDTLTGGSGSDTLVGGVGNDVMSLGADSDRDLVLYNRGDGSDTVRQFRLGQDQFAIVGIAQVDVVKSGSNTQLRASSTSGFGTGQVLMTFEGVTGVNANTITASVGAINAATFVFG
ncbi:MAG TPA: right-handed parallel beta-helix repeat-containing protein [Crinalium sp.]